MRRESQKDVKSKHNGVLEWSRPAKSSEVNLEILSGTVTFFTSPGVRLRHGSDPVCPRARGYRVTRGKKNNAFPFVILINRLCDSFFSFFFLFLGPNFLSP